MKTQEINHAVSVQYNLFIISGARGNITITAL